MFQAIPTEKILAVIERQGPVQPLDVRRALGEGDTMLIGAILSQLHASGKVLITKTKRGGSPFYYLPDKPELLENLAQYLGEKDRRTFDLLREHKVLKADEQEPLTRVSLHNIPDFSRSFTVGESTYWRYYLVEEEQARAMLTPKPAVQEAEPIKVEEKQESPKQEPQEAPKQEKKEEPLQERLANDPLTLKIESFLRKHKGELVSMKIIKENQEIHARARVESAFGKTTYYVAAFARKTLPEQFVWTALLDARSAGLPLLVLKDSAFPKSLAKKFSDVPNVFFSEC